MGYENMNFGTSFILFFLILASAFAPNMDGTLLLALKYSIQDDPSSVLSNWDYDAATPCSWAGVVCAQVEDSLRVISLVLPNSKFSGTIPEDLGLIQHLKTLDLSGNLLNGTLPTSLFNATQLQLLSLSNNAFSGELPEFLEGAMGLQELNLSDNAFGGNIPQTLSSLLNLSVVSVKNNYFSGQIPSRVQQSVEFMDLSSNLFNGSLPMGFGGMNLKHLNLSSNRISGQVPVEFASKIPPNATIDLSFNNLSGEIPETVLFANQETASYEGNINLCGRQLKKLCSVPSTLSTPPNVSSPAIAAIPKIIGGADPFTDSSGTTSAKVLNHDQQPQHQLKPGVVAGIAVGNLAGIGVLAMVLLYVYHRRKKKCKQISTSTTKAHEFKKDSELVKENRTYPLCPCLSIRNGEETSEAASSDTDESNIFYTSENHEKEVEKNEKSLVMVDGETELDVETLLKASAYVLGSTTSSSIVYKAVVEDGTEFAVRRIGESGVKRFKDFEWKVKSIAKLRHPNLVQIKGFYWGDNEKLLIDGYISNGNLANASYRKTRGTSSCHLSLESRLKVARGVARGLSYIHEKKNVHGNIKPSNILLTADMEPMISDFGLHGLIYGKQTQKNDSHGLARHFGSKRSMPQHNAFQDQGLSYIAPVGFVGCTSPYHAPESQKNLKPNPKWDVYSFGILMLELLTGKVFLNRELSQWTAGSFTENPTGVLSMADVALRGDIAGNKDTILAWFKLGFSCASLSPHKRPSMKEALNVLEQFPCCNTS